MRSVSFWGELTSGSRICASRSELFKVPNSTVATLSGFISIQYILPLLLLSHHAHSCFRTLEENACNIFPRVPEKSARINCHLYFTSTHYEYISCQIS